MEETDEEIIKSYESQFGHLLNQLEVALEGVKPSLYRRYKPRKYFTKDMDENILLHLFVDKTYNNLAEEFDFDSVKVLLHVKARFGLPRCAKHIRFSKSCEDCQHSLIDWRTKGSALIQTKKYCDALYSEQEIQVSLYWYEKVHQYIDFRKSLKKGILAFLGLKKTIDFSDDIMEGAMRIFAICLKDGIIRGRKFETVIGACLLISAQNNQAPISFYEISQLMNEKKSNLYQVFKKINEQALPQLNIQRPPSDPRIYIESIVKQLKKPDILTTYAINVLNLCVKNGYDLCGKDPRGLASAAIYLASLHHQDVGNITQRKISSIAKVTEVTIRNRYHDLRKYLSLSNEKTKGEELKNNEIIKDEKITQYSKDDNIKNELNFKDLEQHESTQGLLSNNQDEKDETNIDKYREIKDIYSKEQKEIAKVGKSTKKKIEKSKYKTLLDYL